MAAYELVLTDSFWEFTLKRDSLRPVVGTQQWKISDFEVQPSINIETALRYLGRLQKSESEVVSANAERSIATLMRLKREVDSGPVIIEVAPYARP